MKITWNELIVSFDPHGEDLLSDWRWLIGATSQPILITSLGDAFLQESDGAVYWLKVGEGSYEKIASSGDEFQRQLKSGTSIDDWFLPQLVGDILASGVRFGPNQCLSFKKPPFLSGEYERNNFEVTDLAVHFSILGQLYQQVKDLPEGTRISDIKIEDAHEE
ncbi:MAG: T6SS immunity protein Tdi1 domain-containing protein [Planctomycetota bacterium]|jgi:hypothetical protein